jgi:transposase
VIGSTPLSAGRPGVRVWLATSPVDMRRSFDRLAEHVRTILAHDPLSGHLFVFRNRSAERVKILWWDQDGFAIYYKRLERGTFHWPSSTEPAARAISRRQLGWLLEGLSLEQPQAHPAVTARTII